MMSNFTIATATMHRAVFDKKGQLQILLRRIAALPEDDQAELLQSLVEMRAAHLGIYDVDDDDRAVLACELERHCATPRGCCAGDDSAVSRKYGNHSAAPQLASLWVV